MAEETITVDRAAQARAALAAKRANQPTAAPAPGPTPATEAQLAERREAHAESAAAAVALVAQQEELRPGNVWVRILKKGDGKVATGALNPTTPGDRFPTHKRGDIVQLEKSVAEAQEDNGYVEIQ